MKKLLIHSYFYILPAIVLAQESDETVQTLLEKISVAIINPIINLLLVVATLVFLWGVIQYSLAADSPDKAKKARSQIVWGIVGLAVMASAWSIVNLIEDSLFGL